MREEEYSLGMRALREPEDARGVAVEPLFLDGVLERQRQIFLDQRLVGLPDEAGRKPDEDLVLDERIAELDQHLPARAALAQVLGAVGGGVEVKLRMAPHERDHLVHPWPSAESADDRQLGKVDGHLVEMP